MLKDWASEGHHEHRPSIPSLCIHTNVKFAGSHLSWLSSITALLRARIPHHLPSAIIPLFNWLMASPPRALRAPAHQLMADTLTWKLVCSSCPWGCKRVGHNLVTKQQQTSSTTERGSCFLERPELALSRDNRLQDWKNVEFKNRIAGWLTSQKYHCAFQTRINALVVEIFDLKWKYLSVLYTVGVHCVQ